VNIESENYRSGSRNRYPQKELLLYKMMIRSKKNKLEKIEDRKYRLKRWGVTGGKGRDGELKENIILSAVEMFIQFNL